MVIIEPSNQIFNDALETSDLTTLLTNDRVDLFVGEDISITDIVRRYKENIPIGKTPIIVHPNDHALFGETIRKFYFAARYSNRVAAWVSENTLPTVGKANNLGVSQVHLCA